MEEKVVAISSFLPDFKETLIRKALTNANGDSDLAVELLLTGQVVQDKPLTQEDEDEKLARKLQQQLDFEEKRFFDQDELIARQLCHGETQTDEELAFLLDQKFTNSSYATHYIPPSQSSPLPDFDISTFDESVLNEMLSQVKSSVIPLLSEELKNFSIPDIDESVDIGASGGKLSFGVKNVALAQVKIPEDNLKIQIEGQSIKIEMTDLSATLNQFTWHYDKNTFPKLKDSGKGDAGISKCSIKVAISFGLSPTGVTPTVSSCDVHIEKLDLKISGTAVSILYNMIISAFKSTIKKHLEKALAQLVSEAMSEGSQGFLTLFE